MRIEPPPSEPSAAEHRPAATAAPEPPLEPPGVRCRSHGLRVMPKVGDSVNGTIIISGTCVLPRITAPALRRRRTTSESARAGSSTAHEPLAVTCPAMSVSSLIASGMPSSGRRSPLRRRASACAASARACSSKTTRNALSTGSWLSIRARKRSVSSWELTSPRSSMAACSARPANATSVMRVVEAIGMLHGVRTRETIERLTAIPGRGAGTDAERRAALALERDLAERGHGAWTDTFWLRPGWAWPVVLAAALAAGGSLAAVAWPLAGVIAAALAAVSLALEGAGLTSPLRLLTRRRATQNVVALPEPRDEEGGDVTLLVCAPYDAPRRGLVLNDRWRAAASRLGDVRLWLAGCALVVAGAAAARLAGVDETWLGAIQLMPTVVLIAALAAAVDIALSEHSPGAGPASAAAVALAVHEELAADPDALPVGLVLYGAGASGPHALRAQLRRERADRRRTVVLDLGPCAEGEPAWRSGHPQLRRAAELAADALDLPAPARRPRPARGVRRLPAIRVACLDARGIAARSHQPDDTAEAVDLAATDRAVDLALGVADALAAELATRQQAAA